jgi:hypothetical protein
MSIAVTPSPAFLRGPHLPDSIARLLYRGPLLSTEVARLLVKGGMSAAGARKRVSRLAPGVKRLAFLTFPRNARFLYLEKDFGSPTYWDALIGALLSTKSAYGLALAALRQRGGIVPLKHFAIVCGAPLRQKKHLSPETIRERLNRAQLVGEYSLPGVGPCVALLQGPDRYDGGNVQIRARLHVEAILLKAIGDWLKRLGIVSYDRVAVRDSNSSLPRVGTFAWDLSAPSYLSAFIRATAAGKPKPGFVACDVLSGIQVNEDGLQPFINKCATLRSLRGIAPCLQIFVADHFSPAAFQLAKRSGILPATPSNLFGQDVGEGLVRLFEILTDAAQISVEPEKFQFVFEKLSHIEGAAVNLRGALFEYLAAEIVRRQSASPFVRMGETYKLDDGAKINVDIVSEVSNASVTFIECKGYQPAGLVPDEYVDRWIAKIPRLYEYARKHPHWKQLKIAFEFWSTGVLSKAASRNIAGVATKVRQTKYRVTLMQADAIKNMARSINDRTLLKVLNEHYFQHPLASARKKKLPRVRRAYSLASEPVQLPSEQSHFDEFSQQEIANSPIE